MRDRARIEDALKQIALFRDLDLHSVQELASGCRLRTFPPREALFHEGDPGHTLYFILAGHANVQRVNSLGATVHIARLGPSDCVGEISLLDGSVRSADVVTEDACTVLMLDTAGFDACLERSPRMARQLLAALARRLRNAADTADNLHSLDAMGRLCDYLVEVARTNGEPLPGGAVRIGIRLTQQELASRIGVSRETVNRCLSRLRQLRCVGSAEGRFVLSDLERLRRYAST